MITPFSAFTVYQSLFPHGPGGWGDQTTVAGLLTHFFRAEYGTFQLYSGADARKSDLFHLLYIYLLNLAQNTLFIGVPLAAVGVYECTRGAGGDSMGRLLGWMVVFYWVAFHLMANLPIEDPLFLGVQVGAHHLFSPVLKDARVQLVKGRAGCWVLSSQ